MKIKEGAADIIEKESKVPVAGSNGESSYVRRQREEILRKFTNENNARENYGNIMVNFTIIWLVAILVIMLGVGLGKLHYSDTVLVALITTTTGSAIGFLIIIFNYLFNKDNIQK